ncbi:MAG: T9SS type A sorting domain-containing protein [Bacteroidota bacterium]
MKTVILPIILWIFAIQASAQVLNDEINFEIRIAEFYGNSDNDATSTDEQSMQITTYLTDATGTDIVGPFCAYFDCHTPCTQPEDTEGTAFYFAWWTARSFDLSFDMNLHAWGDESDFDCEFIPGEDQDEFMGRASDYNLINPVITNNRASVEWHTNFGSNDGWVFPNDILFNLKPTAIWRYAAGDDCTNPLNFGTIFNGETKTHVNTNRSTPGQILGGAAVGYTNQGGMTEAPDVYYTFSLTETSLVSISTIDGDTDYDTYLNLYHSDCSTLIAENDDASDFELRSTIELTLDPGQYTVVVEGYAEDQGDFVLSVSAETVVNTTDLNPTLPISVSPNPTSGLLFLNIAETMQLNNATVEVIGLHGRVLQRTELTPNTSTLDLSAYPAGTYLLRIITDQGQVSKKIVLY